MTGWVDNSVEARGHRRAVAEGRKRPSEVPAWALWQTPASGGNGCPDCGHGPHQPHGALAGKMCDHSDCYCRRVNDVNGRPHG